MAPRGGAREGAGRKSELPGDPKETMSFRFSKSERKKIEEGAKKANLKVSEYVRKKVLE